MLSAKQNEYLVYKHTNKANGKVYIGITKQTAERRWQRGAGYKGTYFGCAIAKYGWDGFDHEVLFSGLSKEDACAIERELIRQHCSNDREKGYNISSGGETADTLHPCYGEANCRAVSVKRIDPHTGDVVIYKTMTAAVSDMGINHRGISKACRGIAKTYKGYIWEYADRHFEKPKKYPMGKHPHDSFKKKVRLIDANGETHIFNSINEAGEKTGIRPNTISRYLIGIRKDASGRRWSYVLE